MWQIGDRVWIIGNGLDLPGKVSEVRNTPEGTKFLVADFHKSFHLCGEKDLATYAQARKSMRVKYAKKLMAYTKAAPKQSYFSTCTRDDNGRCLPGASSSEDRKETEKKKEDRQRIKAPKVATSSASSDKKRKLHKIKHKRPPEFHPDDIVRVTRTQTEHDDEETTLEKMAIVVRNHETGLTLRWLELEKE